MACRSQVDLLAVARLVLLAGCEAQLRAGCMQFTRCRYDEGAFGAVIDKREYVSDDLNHFSIAGHAQAAATAWVAMKRAGLLPRPG